MSLNACVLLEPVANGYSDSDPLLQPRSLGIPKRRTGVRESLFFWAVVVILVKNRPGKQYSDYLVSRKTTPWTIQTTC